MENIVFANLDNYMDMYKYVVQKPRAKNEIIDYLVESVGKKKKTATEHATKAQEGAISFLSFDDKQDRVVFDAEGFVSAMKELGDLFGFTVEMKPKSQRPVKPEDLIAVIESGHSPRYDAMKKLANSAEKEIKERDLQIEKLKSEVKMLRDEVVLQAAKQKVLVVGSLVVKPEERFKDDFFADANEKLLEIPELLSRYGGETSSIYEPIEIGEKKLTAENYIKRVCEQLFHGGLLKRKLKEQDGSQGKIRQSADMERSRLESVNEILSLKGVSNQVKLSLYAAWMNKDDPEMIELLDYAGEQGINADYVIRLLEKPKEYQNYRTLRAMLMQATKASEAHIKKEAAMELLSGDWYVEANYAGENCRFQMVPLPEIEKFKRALSAHETKEAIGILDGMLLENEISVGTRTIDKKETDIQIQVPDFLHQAESESGVDCHEDLNEEIIYEQFKEEEEQSGTE